MLQHLLEIHRDECCSAKDVKALDSRRPASLHGSASSSMLPFRCSSTSARVQASASVTTLRPKLRDLRTHRPQHQPQPSRRVLQTAALDSRSAIAIISLSKGPQIHAPHTLPRHRSMATHSHSHGHSHSHHHHHHDNTYLVSQNKNDAGVRITRIGLFSNLGMAVAKGVGGYAFNSQSMIADAWHSVTDLASDFLTLATVSWSLTPPTASFPTGFGKVESLGSLGVSGMLLLGGCFMCLNSCEILYAHFFLDAQAAAEAAAHAHGHSHGHSHSHGAAGPSIHAAWLAAGTVILKEWLYHASKFSIGRGE